MQWAWEAGGEAASRRKEPGLVAACPNQAAPLPCGQGGRRVSNGSRARGTSGTQVFGLHCGSQTADEGPLPLLRLTSHPVLPQEQHGAVASLDDANGTVTSV